MIEKLSLQWTQNPFDAGGAQEEAGQASVWAGVNPTSVKGLEKLKSEVSSVI